LTSISSSISISSVSSLSSIDSDYPRKSSLSYIDFWSYTNSSLSRTIIIIHLSLTISVQIITFPIIRYRIIILLIKTLSWIILWLDIILRLIINRITIIWIIFLLTLNGMSH
jgi:hypothetical protein